MEETNYHRKTVGGGESNKDNEADLGSGKLDTSVIAEEEGPPDKARGARSSYEKLKVFRKQDLRYPNRLKSMVLRPLIFLTFPVILYSGFSYGSNLVWFNVLNGTASLVLSSNPYGFSSSTVGLAYISPLIGMILA